MAISDPETEGSSEGEVRCSAQVPSPSRRRTNSPPAQRRLAARFLAAGFFAVFFFAFAFTAALAIVYSFSLCSLSFESVRTREQ